MDDEVRELVAHATRPERRYPVKTNADYGFYAGSLTNGRQALATLDVQLLFEIAFFDVTGEFVGEEKRDLAGRWPIPAHGYPEINQAELHEYLRNEFGFTPATIRVEWFETEYGVKIQPLTYWMQRWVTDPTSHDDPERALKLLRKWVENEEFVLLFGNDYFLNKDGEVTAS